MAKLAGVSRATVSYVLNAVPHQTIPESTRQRVLDAARQLGYQPSPAARTLRKGRSDIVLGLIGDIPYGPTYHESFAELGKALAEHRLLLVVHPFDPTTFPLAQVWRTLTPACVFSFAPFSEADVVAMRAAGTDVAVTFTHSAPRNPWEMSDGDQNIGSAQAGHLLSLGHREVVIAVPTDPRAAILAEGRIAAVRDIFTTAGHRPPQVLCLPVDPGAASEVLARWRQGAPAVTALVAWNDDLGAIITGAAGQLGWTVPGDLAVVGAYDQPAGVMSSPQLTTVKVDTRARMRVIAAMIAAAVDGSPIELDPLDQSTLSVILRGST